MNVFRRRMADFVLFCSAEDTVSVDYCNSAVRGCSADKNYTVCFVETDAAERDCRTRHNMFEISAVSEHGPAVRVFSVRFAAEMNRTNDRHNIRQACCTAVRGGICTFA